MSSFLFLGFCSWSFILNISFICRRVPRPALCLLPVQFCFIHAAIKIFRRYFLSEGRLSDKLRCNVISDECGKPRVMSCLAATQRLRFLRAGCALGRNDTDSNSKYNLKQLTCASRVSLRRRDSICCGSRLTKGEWRRLYKRGRLNIVARET